MIDFYLGRLQLSTDFSCRFQSTTNCLLTLSIAILIELLIISRWLKIIKLISIEILIIAITLIIDVIIITVLLITRITLIRWLLIILLRRRKWKNENLLRLSLSFRWRLSAVITSSCTLFIFQLFYEVEYCCWRDEFVNIALKTRIEMISNSIQFLMYDDKIDVIIMTYNHLNIIKNLTLTSYVLNDISIFDE